MLQLWKLNNDKRAWHHAIPILALRRDGVEMSPLQKPYDAVHGHRDNHNKYFIKVS